MMKLECEYIELLQDGATFSEDILSQYPEDILQGAVSMERELLVLDHPELIEMITGENHSSMPDSLRSLASVTDTMKHARSYSLWEQRETYPNFVEDLNIDYKINRLENLVNSRKGYLALEDEYLRLLRETYQEPCPPNSFRIHLGTYIEVNIILEEEFEIDGRCSCSRP